MIDQLVSSHGRIFFGCWFNTSTGYINRIRGYHSVKDKLPGYKSGELPTTSYYATIDRKFEMHKVRTRPLLSLEAPLLYRSSWFVSTLYDFLPNSTHCSGVDTLTVNFPPAGGTLTKALGHWLSIRRRDQAKRWFKKRLLSR
jgi:hypothetical protein